MADNVVRFRKIEKKPEKQQQQKPSRPPGQPPRIPTWALWAIILALAVGFMLLQNPGVLG